MNYNIYDSLILIYKREEKYFNNMETDRQTHTHWQNLLSYKCLRNTTILISINIMDSVTALHSLYLSLSTAVTCVRELPNVHFRLPFTFHSFLVLFIPSSSSVLPLETIFFSSLVCRCLYFVLEEYFHNSVPVMIPFHSDFCSFCWHIGHKSYCSLKLMCPFSLCYWCLSFWQYGFRWFSLYSSCLVFSELTKYVWCLLCS